MQTRCLKPYLILDPASSSICRDFLRNVCKRGAKCRFLHPKPFSSDTENARPEKRIRQHEETNNSYNNKNDTAGSAVGDRNGHKESTAKDTALGGNSMQLKVSTFN